MGESFVVKARGLPWSSTANEVVNFFSDVSIVNGEDGVHFTFNKDGRPSGECFIEVTAREDVESALSHDNEHMGKRYIEVKEAKHSEMEWVVNRMSSHEQNSGVQDGVVRLRGLPYGCSKQDIADFFTGLQISPYGITITMDQDGRASGDAYVEFASNEDAEKAMGKHKEKIGHRYIEIFRSSKADIKYVVGGRNDGRGPPLMQNSRPGPYDRPNYSGRARGRGAASLGPSGFSSSFSGNFDNGGIRGSRGGGGKSMRGGRLGGGGIGGGGMNNRSGSVNVQQSKTGHSVHMRGLPFEATAEDVMRFFSPLRTVDVRLVFEPNGRPKGECDVDFATHRDAEMAMQKDNQNMGHRYIELFLKSTMIGNSNVGGGRWSNNNNSSMNRGGSMMNRGNVNPSGFGNDSSGYDSGYSIQDRSINMGSGSIGGGPGGNMGGGPVGNMGNSHHPNSSYGFDGGYENSDFSYPMQNQQNFFGQNVRS